MSASAFAKHSSYNPATGNFDDGLDMPQDGPGSSGDLHSCTFCLTISLSPEQVEICDREVLADLLIASLHAELPSGYEESTLDSYGLDNSFIVSVEHQGNDYPTSETIAQCIEAYKVAVDAFFQSHAKQGGES